MRKFAFIFCLFFELLSGYAQNYSQVNHGNLMAFGGGPSMFKEVGDTLYTLTHDHNKPKNIIFRSFNRSGSLIDSAYYAFNDTSISLIGIRSTSLTRLSSSKLVAFIDVFYTNNTAHTLIIKTNLNFDTVKNVIFKPLINQLFNSFDIVIEDTAVTLLGHYVLPNNKLHLFLARFDTALNLQWHTTIQDFRPIVNQYYNGYYPYRLRRIGSNYYIAGRCLYTTQFVEGFLVKTDLLGNKVWDKRYQYNNLNSVITDIEKLGSDSIIVLNNFLTQVNGNISYNKLRIFITDTSGTLIKDSVYPDEEIVYISEKIRLIDESIYVIGNFYQGGSKAVLWKLDKNLNTIWRRVYYYGDWEDESWLYNVDQWSDGGIIAAGTYWDRYMNPTNKSVYLWLLSTDSLGCLSPGNCGSDINVVEWALPGQGIKVYPNPIAISTVDYINIQLTITGNPNTTASVRMFNEAGQVVLKENLEFVDGLAQLGLSQLGSGNYVLEVKTATHVFYEKIIIQ